MSEEERLTSIIGIRFYPSWKRQLMEEAEARGETLSEYIDELIETGWQQINKENMPIRLMHQAIEQPL